MMCLRRILNALWLGSLLGACGGSTNDDGAGSGGVAGASGSAAASGSGGASGSGAVSGASGNAGSGGNIPCEGIVACCDSQGNPVPPICPGGGPAECPPGTYVPPSGICSAASSCSPNQPCSAEQYCDYADDRCGAGEPGKCVPRPKACDFSYAPVCGCDATVHANDCAARANGTDVSSIGGCTPPEGYFACGPLFCQLGWTYCLHAVSDVGGIPDTYACQQLPSGCGKTPTCACMAGEPCGTWCETSELGAITLTCPGG